MLHLSDFDYKLPKNLIASKPHKPRDECKLLVFDRKTKQIKHTRFDKILNFLNSKDILVLNNTKVIPARLIGKRIGEKGESGRKFKILLLRKIPLSPPLEKGELKGDLWEVLIDGKKRNVGIKINFGKGLIGEILKSPTQPPPFSKKEERRGVWEMKFNKTGKEFWNLVFKLGKMPLPPYIKQSRDLSYKNRKWYQTVYAKYAGSVAAPTAGLHFTKKLLKKLKQKSVQVKYITLHVGLGTFAPVREENIKKHKMHAEYAEISAKTAAALNKAKKKGQRIVAVGTTTTRVLEAIAFRHSERSEESRTGRSGHNGSEASREKFIIKPFAGKVNIFIYPPYKFKFVDALITNFHLPKSTLLMLVAAFMNLEPKKSVKLLKKIYKQAIDKNYRFYSYGDAMFIT